MRAVVQRVSEARVRVSGEVVGSIGEGLLVYLAIGSGDSARDVDYMVRKIVGLRVFEDSDGHMNVSIQERGGEILLVSQFTLFGDCRRGLRPSFHEAMGAEAAQELLESLRLCVEEAGVKTEVGRFRAMMEVESRNHGPVTILLDSKKSF